MLAPACAVPSKEGGKNTCMGIEARGQICDFFLWLHKSILSGQQDLAFCLCV